MRLRTKVPAKSILHTTRLLLLVSVSMLLLSVTAIGATNTSNCTPFPVTFNNGTGGPTPVSCPPFTMAGATLNSVTLSYLADYQFGSNPGPNTVMTDFTPTGPPGVTWAPPTFTTTTTGGVSSGSPGSGSATAASGVTAANFAAAFNVNVTPHVTQGTVATSSGAVTVTYTFTPFTPPPPPSGPICSPAAPVFVAGVPNAFQVRYISNLNVGDSFVNITNTGASSTLAFPTQNGNLHVNVYTFDPNEELISCCCCPVTPDGLASLSARNDLINNTLTPGVPTSVVVKLLATDSTGLVLVDGLAAWATSLHAQPVTPGTPATTFGLTETPFTRSTLSAAELARITSLCSFIQTNGSGFGVCNSCRLGGLGAVKQ